MTDDSHARGCTVEIANLMGKWYEVTGTAMPGARNKTITSLADKEISNLSKEDILIVCSSAKEISRNETNTGLTHIGNFCSLSHKY